MAQIALRDSVSLMTGYNLWANQQFIQFFESVPEELLEQYVAGSFPSIRNTLVHIWDAQDIWFKRLHGKNPRHLLSADWNGSLKELFEGLMSSSEEYHIYTKGLDDDALEQEFSYETITSGLQRSRRFEVLLHVYNHSTYHRGQCITMARAVGLDLVPATDLIRFLRLV
jgi:uncharacterized damage-inducible protein DinB